jgi:hypothetical protein
MVISAGIITPPAATAEAPAEAAGEPGRARG